MSKKYAEWLLNLPEVPEAAGMLDKIVELHGDTTKTQTLLYLRFAAPVDLKETFKKALESIE